MARPDQLPYEQRVDDLLAVYRQAQRTIVAQVRAALAAGDLNTAARRRAQLAAVLTTLDQLGIETELQARRLVRDAYRESVTRTGDLITRIGPHVTFDTGTFAAVETDAVAALQDEMLGRLQDARRTIGRQVNDLFARAGRETTMQALLGAQGSPRAATDALTQRLRDRGVRAFTDRAGRQWTLQAYSQMAVRTVTREAVVEGAKQRMAAQGVTVARVSTHASSCKICQPWEGRLVTLTGSRADYNGQPVADLASMPNGGPPFHPNCRHTLLPVAEGIAAFRAAQTAGTGA